MSSLQKIMPVFKAIVHNFYLTWPLNAMAETHKFNSTATQMSTENNNYFIFCQ